MSLTPFTLLSVDANFTLVFQPRENTSFSLLEENKTVFTAGENAANLLHGIVTHPPTKPSFSGATKANPGRVVGTRRRLQALPEFAFTGVFVRFHREHSGRDAAVGTGSGDISHLSLCRPTVIYGFSHEAKSTLGDSLLHLKLITVK